MRTLPALLLAAAALAGCARTPAAIPAAAVEAYPLRAAQAGVHAAADPFFATERARDAFTGGEDFEERGLLAVQVILQNRGPEEVRVNPGEAAFFSARGRAAPSLHPEDAFGLIKLPVGWWALGAGYVGGSTQAYRNEARRRDLQARALPAQVIPPGGAASGFLYFQIAEDTMDLAGSRLVLPLHPAAGAPVRLELPLAGRRDVPAPSGHPGAAPPPKTRAEGGGGRGIIIRSP